MGLPDQHYILCATGLPKALVSPDDWTGFVLVRSFFSCKQKKIPLARKYIDMFWPFSGVIYGKAF